MAIVGIRRVTYLPYVGHFFEEPEFMDIQPLTSGTRYLRDVNGDADYSLDS